MDHWNIRKIYMPIFLGGSLLIFSAMAHSQSSSANYQIPMLIPDEGGGRSTSQNYILNLSIGQPAAGQSNSANYNTILGIIPTLVNQMDIEPPDPVTAIYSDHSTFFDSGYSPSTINVITFWW